MSGNDIGGTGPDTGGTGGKPDDQNGGGAAGGGSGAASDFGDDLDKWKSHSRKHENENARLKAELDKQQKALEAERQKSMTEAEKAIAAAREEGKAEALKSVGGRLVESELKVALAGRAVKSEALLSFDRQSFLTDGGEVDTEALKKWVEANTTAADTKPPVKPNPRRPNAVPAPKGEDGGAPQKQSASLLRQLRGTT
jgi:hypothetical protein